MMKKYRKSLLKSQEGNMYIYAALAVIPIIGFVEILFRGQEEAKGLYVALVSYVTQVNVGYRPEWLRAKV